MPSIAKPPVAHPSLTRNELGLTIRDYEGTMSTLCAGCGHDSITAAIIRALWELSTPPHRLAKLSGIGCSSKTPTYFVKDAHGFNSAHGRMPPIATGANAANRELTYIGVSGDGDSLSIGLGHLCHAMRRNVNMLYVIENNGVYGLTKGQFSASSDVGSKSKKGEANVMSPIDPILLGLSLGATFVARSFSGDKEQLVPILKAGLAHRGFALVDVISPCVTFNDHEGSTKSYLYTRQHLLHATESDFVPHAREIVAEIAPTGGTNVTMHDGSVLRFTRLPADYDVSDRQKAFSYLKQHSDEVVTGILFADESVPDMHETNRTPRTALTDLPFDRLCPGALQLEQLQEEFR
ncbi:MAG: 2-oxoacid:ferredoxin oxidoreductase subunit beta [Bryobacteraceae bacterium]|jgi:2-oxoglutarate ferredoxin oxidoreductase subunit beta